MLLTIKWNIDTSKVLIKLKHIALSKRYGKTMHKKVEAEKRLQQLQFVFTHRERNIGKYRDLLDERVLNANFNFKVQTYK